MSNDREFSGRVVAILAKEPARGGVLENPSIRQLADQSFIVGQLAPKQGDADPRAGLTIWFALEEVVMITEFPNLEAAEKVYSHWQGTKSRGWFGR